MRLDEKGRVLIPAATLIPLVWAKGTFDSAKSRGKIETTGRGGRGRHVEIVFDTLSEKYKAKICARLGDPRQILGLVPVEKKSDRVPFSELNAKQVQLCNAKYNIVTCYREFAELHKAEAGITAAKREFINLVQQGVLCGDSYEVVGSISFQTVERWNKELREGGDIVDAFAPVRVARKAITITPEQQQVLIEQYCRDSKPSVADAYYYAVRIWEAMKIDASDIPTESACRRFLNGWIAKNQATVMFRREGLKALKDKVLPSLERDPDSIKYLDCLVADGKVLNFQVVNPDTGKLCRPTLIGWMDFRTMQILGFELMVTENTMSVASAFRQACINAGSLMGIDGAVLPRMIYMDNGKAFKNKFFNEKTDLKSQLGGLFSRLEPYGLEHVIYARPYNARTKIIERAWQSFTTMEQLANTYTGDRLANKPAALMRNEKWHRTNREKDIAKNGYPTLWGAYKAVEWWVTEYNNMVGSGKYLDGTTPNALALEQITQIDVRNRIIAGKGLDYMMLHSKTLKLTPNGFKINGTSYYNPEFANRVGNGDEYIVRYDPMHPAKVLVFQSDGRLWCEAGEFFGGGLHAAAVLGSEADRERVRNAQHTLASLEKATVAKAKVYGAGPQLPELPEFNTPMEIPGRQQAVLAASEYDPDDPRNPNFRLF